jgi:hypothetical protein
MMSPKPVQNSGGGEINQMNEIKLGEATYMVHRTFSDDRSVSDLIVDRLIQNKKEMSTFDESTDDAV